MFVKSSAISLDDLDDQIITRFIQIRLAKHNSAGGGLEIVPSCVGCAIARFTH